MLIADPVAGGEWGVWRVCVATLVSCFSFRSLSFSNSAALRSRIRQKKKMDISCLEHHAKTAKSAKYAGSINALIRDTGYGRAF